MEDIFICIMEYYCGVDNSPEKAYNNLCNDASENYNVLDCMFYKATPIGIQVTVKN
jgi:hypothetical protein